MKPTHFYVETAVEEQYSGLYKTVYELREIAQKHTGEMKKRMNEEISWISSGLMERDDLTNLTVEQAKLFGFLK